jgi:hypothetical protein
MNFSYYNHLASFGLVRSSSKAHIINILRDYILYCYIFYIHVTWGPCPHSMARPRVADGGTASRYGG